MTTDKIKSAAGRIKDAVKLAEGLMRHCLQGPVPMESVKTLAQGVLDMRDAAGDAEAEVGRLRSDTAERCARCNGPADPVVCVGEERICEVCSVTAERDDYRAEVERANLAQIEATRERSIEWDRAEAAEAIIGEVGAFVDDGHLLMCDVETGLSDECTCGFNKLRTIISAAPRPRPCWECAELKSDMKRLRQIVDCRDDFNSGAEFAAREAGEAVRVMVTANVNLRQELESKSSAGDKATRHLVHPGALVSDLWDGGGIIYVENIRAAADITTKEAKEYCEEAVRQGLLEDVVAYECPNEICRRVIRSTSPRKPMPTHLTCDNCEMTEQDEYEWRTSELPRTLCYCRAAKEAPND